VDRHPTDLRQAPPLSRDLKDSPSGDSSGRRGCIFGGAGRCLKSGRWLHRRPLSRASSPCGPGAWEFPGRLLLRRRPKTARVAGRSAGFSRRVHI